MQVFAISLVLLLAFLFYSSFQSVVHLVTHKAKMKPKVMASLNDVCSVIELTQVSESLSGYGYYI